MGEVDEARARLSVLRREAAQLLSLIDTSEYPAPSGQDIHPGMLGPYWEVDNLGVNRGPRWRVFADPQHPDVVFLGEQEYESFCWSADRWTPAWADIQCVRVEVARKYAMSILAACRWLDERRKPDLRVED